jgi:hypothetical protein
MRDAVQRVVIHVDACLAGQADIGVVHDQPGAIAILVEFVLEISEALQFIGCAGQLHPAGELLHMPHQDRSIDGFAQRVAHCISHGIFSH